MMWCTILFMRKRSILLIIAGLAVFTAVHLDNGTNANAKNSANIVDYNIDVNSISSITSLDQDTMVLGKLYFVNLKEGEKPVMTALSLFGNRCGTEGFNHKPFAAEGIRSVFELDEWIEFYLKANTVSGIKVMVFEHNADQGFYLKNALNENASGYIQECDLNKDPEAEESSDWGSFYLHPQEVNPGYYDFVFIYKNKVFATMLTRFFNQMNSTINPILSWKN